MSTLEHDDVAAALDIVARSVLVLEPVIARLGPSGCRRLGRAIAAAFPELCLVASTVDKGDATGTDGDGKGTRPLCGSVASPVPVMIDRSRSSSEDLKKDHESLSPLLEIGREREGDAR